MRSGRRKKKKRRVSQNLVMTVEILIYPTVCFDYLSAPLPIRPCEIISVQKQLYGSNQSRVTDRGVWDLSIIGKTGHFELCSMAESLSPWSGRFLPNLCIKDYRLRQSPRLRTILLFLPRFRFQIFKPIYFSKWLFILGHSNSISNLNFSPKNGQNLKIFFNGNSYDKLQSPQSQKIYSIDFLNRCSGSFLRFKPSTVWKLEKKTV